MRKGRLSILLAGWITLALISICCPDAESKILLVDDFDEQTFLNKLRGESYIWNVNPQDKSQGCGASFDSKIRVGETGSSLRLDYDIDSTLTYLREFPDTPYYIYDYDTDSIIGFAREIPHTAYNGFYFLLNNANLKGYKYLIFYVKGDPLQGFTRKFIVELKNIDQTDRFLVDGVSPSWQKVVVPLGKFKRIGQWEKMTELTIVFNENVTRKAGTIYIDNIYFAQSPEEELGQKAPSDKNSLQGNPKEYSEKKGTDLGATIYTAYSYTPEEKSRIFGMGSLSLEGRLSRFGGKMEIAAETQNFGEAAYGVELENWPFEETQRQSPSLEFPTIQFMVNDILPQASRLTLGHLWLDSSRYTFSPFYGWKGLSIDGDYHGLNYNTFFIKQPFNSYTLGSRFRQYWRYFHLEAIGIHHSETARLSGSSGGDGTLEDTNKVEPVERDTTFMFRVIESLLSHRIIFEGIYGQDMYRQYAEVDRTDPTEPTYSQKLDSPVSNYGNMWRGKLIFDNFLWRGSRLSYGYRWVGENFKPEYRQEPTVFDDVDGDQKGYNVQFDQSYGGYVASIAYDDIARNSNRDYGRKRTNLSLYYYGFRGMELGVFREYRKEDYKYTSLRSSLDVDRNEKVTVSELYLRFHLVHPVTPGLRLPLVLWFKFRREDIEHPLTGRTYLTDSFQTRIEYYPTSYLKLLGTYKTTRFGDPSWEPKGYPFADNFAQIAFEVMF